MSAAADLVISRLDTEEGTRTAAYDDATGKTVRAPTGNLSWGRGFNLEACASTGLFDVMEQYLVGACETEIAGYYWYQGLDAPRQSVLLDMAYNMGVKALLGYPKMLAFIVAKAWANAAKECYVTQVNVNSIRYVRLRAILATGDASAQA